MKINDIKHLEQVIKLCRKQGVSTIEVDGIKLTLAPIVKPKQTFQAPDISNDFPEAQLQVPKYTGVTPDVNDKITNETEAIDMPDELTEDQLLNWSSAPSNNTGMEQ